MADSSELPAFPRQFLASKCVLYIIEIAHVPKDTFLRPGSNYLICKALPVFDRLFIFEREIMCVFHWRKEWFRKGLQPRTKHAIQSLSCLFIRTLKNGFSFLLDMYCVPNLLSSLSGCHTCFLFALFPLHSAFLTFWPRLLLLGDMLGAEDFPKGGSANRSLNFAVYT